MSWSARAACANDALGRAPRVFDFDNRPSDGLAYGTFHTGRAGIRSNATIRDVARAAGVSIQTVSNVLNQRHGVAAETRRRVREAAQRLGYRPSAAARSLRTGRTHSIGLVVRDIANPFYAELARGVEDAARVQGYPLVIGSTSNELDKIRDLLGVFRELRVAGVVASTNPIRPEYPDLIEDFAQSTPIVQLGAAARAGRISRVLVDERRGGFVATAHLLSLGRKRVAIVTGPLDSYAGSQRLEGYKQAIAAWAQGFDPALVVEGRFSFQSGYDAVDQLWARSGRPDALFAANDLVAIGAITRLRERRIRVPEQVAIIGYDDAEVGRLYEPPISTIAQPTYELGRRGVELLLAQLGAAHRDPEAGQPTPRDEMLDCTLIVRRSSSGRDRAVDCGPISAEAPWRVYLAELAPSPESAIR